jgi:hypothetical protein
MLVSAYIVVAVFTAYFFYKVMTTPTKDEGDFPPGP